MQIILISFLNPILASKWKSVCFTKTELTEDLLSKGLVSFKWKLQNSMAIYWVKKKTFEVDLLLKIEAIGSVTLNKQLECFLIN